MSRGQRWTDDELAWLATLYPGERLADVAFALGRRNKLVSTQARNRGIAKVATEHESFTADEDAWIAALYPDLQTADVAFALGRTGMSVYRRAAKLGIRKSEAFWVSDRSGRIQRGFDWGKRHRFQKGHIPANKGRKGYHAPGSEKGWFQKGHQRNDTAPVGAERIDPKDGYVLVKVTPEIQGNKALPWQPKHRVLWEAANGPVPKGMVLKCVDGNKQNCALDNWELITLRENMLRNTIHNYPREIVQVTMLRGAINRRLNGQRRREHATEK